MSGSRIKTFHAVLERLPGGLGWVIARVPFDAAEAWPERRGQRIKGTIEGFPFRSSLFPFTKPETGRYVLVNKTMQAAARARVGSRVKMELEPDLEEREPAIPAELARALKGDRRLGKYFAGFSESNRKEMGHWVSQPKSAESRARRAEELAERLLLSLEGEQQTPPILEAAFQRQPLARAGWNQLTRTKRRSHLMGIFACKSIDSRQKRTARAVEDALNSARGPAD
jgi:uncharacterized protein YdeI (YjbR/CyaY-like superfamily)